MMSPRTVSELAAAGLLLAGGCLPTEMPGYSPDGRTVAVVTQERDPNEHVLWLYDVRKGAARAHRLPGDWQLRSARWLGRELWVQASRDVGVRKDPKTGKPLLDKKTGKPVRDHEFIFAPLDRERNVLSRRRRLKVIPPFVEPVPAGYNGKPALFLTNLEARREADPPMGEEVYDVLSLPDLKKLETVQQPRMIPAGRGWALRQLAKEGERGLTAELAATVVLNEKGREVATIPAGEIAPACYRGVRFPSYARVSADAAAVLMAFGTETIFRRYRYKYTFGVFDVKSAKLLWSGSSDSLFGTPIVKPREVWTLEMVGRKVDTGERTIAAITEPPASDPAAGKFALVRLTPGGKRTYAAGRRQVVLEVDLGEGHTAGEFAPSPDGSQLLLTVNGPEPKLLFVPIGQNVTPKDLRVVRLRRTATSAPARGAPPS